MKEGTTYGLSPERLARLLAIGLEKGDEEEKPSGERSVAEVLRDALSACPILDPAKLGSLPAVLNRPCAEMQAVAGRTIAELLFDSKTDLAIIRTLKEYGKELARRSGPEAEKAAVTAIYYAAIASALVFHGNKVTQHSCGALQESYEDLEQKEWISPDLKDLFKRAKAACQEKKS